MANSELFRALVATSNGVELEDFPASALDSGEVLIRVSWSGLNYKDLLASRVDGKVASKYPLIPGIDLVGEVVSDSSGNFEPGELVLGQGFGLGVDHHGGLAEYARVPARWLISLPEELIARDAMAVGTAGFTAALSVQCLQDAGIAADSGPVLVTGATGGVGSHAVQMLARLGYEVVAVTGSSDSRDWLDKLGAAKVMSRDDLAEAGSRPLGRQQWSGVVDSVGGDYLAAALSTVAYGGVVAASGNVAGMKLNTTVLPFILRGVRLQGIDSVQAPLEVRRKLWTRIASDLRPARLEEAVTTVPLSDVVKGLELLSSGDLRGRVVVSID